MSLGYAPRLTKPATINFNDRIRLKLTAEGWAAHRQWHRAIFSQFSDIEYARDFPYSKPEVGEDGCCEFHLWEAASIFGRKLYNGCKPPFELSGVVVPFDYSARAEIVLAETRLGVPAREVDLP